jgi:hypothetical protein
MKTKIFPISLTLVFISVLIFSSCKSSFPVAGTAVDCNGKILVPIKNPTIRADYPGGKQAIYKFLRENIELPREGMKKGKVRVAFIVTKDGETCDVRITSKSREYIDSEVVRVINMMTGWNPGSNNGEIIDCYYLLDIDFN